MTAISMELTEAYRYLFLFNGEKNKIGKPGHSVYMSGEERVHTHPVISKGSLWNVLSHGLLKSSGHFTQVLLGPQLSSDCVAV